MKFIDEVKILVRGGDGGRGCVAFRREPFRPRCGPSGGNGGDGGDVIMETDPGLYTLLDLRYNPRHLAGRGTHGGGNDKTGRNGKSKVIRVPVGTIVRDNDTGDILADLTAPGEHFIAARGGRGGRGNASFLSNSNRAPEYAQPGEEGEERSIKLELKLLADVGLIGFPNVGKSTLISRISKARPKIADYPFTTLTPKLGMVRLDVNRSFVVADIPGLIPDAHKGAGLGMRFLRHVERTRVLLHLITLEPNPEREPLLDFKIINRELALHSPKLAERRQLVALTKLDLPEVREQSEELAMKFKKSGCEFHAISALTGEGVKKLLGRLGQIVLEKEPEFS